MMNHLRQQYGQGRYGIRHATRHDIVLPWRFRSEEEAQARLWGMRSTSRGQHVLEVFDTATLSTSDHAQAYAHH